jgi:hypothetical protein
MGLSTEHTLAENLQGQQGDWKPQAYPTHDKTKAIFSYWKSKCGGHAMPLRSSVDPIEIPHLLPMICLMEVEIGPPIRFKMRLLGTAAVNIVGEERTGRYLDEFGENIPDGARQEIVGRWQKTCLGVYTNQCPIFAQGVRRNPEKTYQSIHAGALPLTSDGNTVSHVIGLIVTEALKSTNKESV